MNRWTDAEGHNWPVTGHWCSICGLPRIDVGDGASTHPGCGDLEEVDR